MATFCSLACLAQFSRAGAMHVCILPFMSAAETFCAFRLSRQLCRCAFPDIGVVAAGVAMVVDVAVAAGVAVAAKEAGPASPQSREKETVKAAIFMVAS